MALLELMLAEITANATLGITVFKAQERANTRAALMDWELDNEPTPVVDGILEKMSGTLETARERKLITTIVSAARSREDMRTYAEKFSLPWCPCEICGTATTSVGTKRCDACWELDTRIKLDLELAKKIIARLESEPT